MKPNALAARKFLFWGLSLLPVGIAFASGGKSGSGIGGAFMLVGLGLLVAGLHTFGRAGPDLGE